MAWSISLMTVYGHCTWYRRMCLITEKLNYDSNEERAIPGIPVSGIWLNTNPKTEKVHCDANVVGPTFLLTTKASEGGNLIMCTSSRKLMKVKLKPNMIVAGKWAQYAHCNTKVNSKGRTSWTIYLDWRVFSSNYVHKTPKGFQF